MRSRNRHLPGSRRPAPDRWLALGAAVLVLLGACSSDSDSNGEVSEGEFSDVTLVVATPGGDFTAAIKEAYADPFTEATGAEVTLVEADIDGLVAGAEAQGDLDEPEWDLVLSLAYDVVQRLGEGGSLATIDSASIPSYDLLPEGAAFEYGIAIEVDTIVASYTQADGVTPLDSVADFFDPAVEGPRGAAGTASDAPFMCTLALLADGVAPEDLAPLDLDRCFSVWDPIKDQVDVWFQSGSEMQQLMVDDQIDYCLCFDGRVLQAMNTNPDWTFTRENAIGVNYYISVIEGTPETEAANAFIEQTLDPERQAVFVEAIGYSTPNPETVNFLPEELKPLLATTPEEWAKLAPLPDEFWTHLAEASEDIGRAWLEYIAT